MPVCDVLGARNQTKKNHHILIFMRREIKISKPDERSERNRKKEPLICISTVFLLLCGLLLVLMADVDDVDLQVANKLLTCLGDGRQNVTGWLGFSANHSANAKTMSRLMRCSIYHQKSLFFVLRIIFFITILFLFGGTRKKVRPTL
jgi:hypothetical protein